MICDDSVLELLTGEDTLRDSVLIRVTISESHGLATVDFNFEAREGSQFSYVTIKFTGLIEFEFTYHEDDIFLDVWDLKFLKLKDGTYYIALDPDPATLPAAGVTDIDASETDHFFVRARRLEAEVTKPRTEK